MFLSNLVEAEFSWSVLLLILLSFIFVTLRALAQAYLTPLRDVPGPWLAKFTRLWLLKAYHSRSFHQTNIRLHQKYGPIVRIAPNEYSIDDPEAAKIIYRPRDQLQKAPRYSAWGMPGKDQNLFAERDIHRHAERRRQAATMYHMNILLDVEDQVDDITAAFCERMYTFAELGEAVEINQWLHFYAFDVIGKFTLGRAFGFLSKGADISEIMSAIHSFSRYGAVVGVYNEWHSLIFKVLQMMTPSGAQGLAYIAQFAGQTISDRGKQEKWPDKKGDMLSSLYAMHQQDPKSFKIEDIVFHTVPNIGAGSDTTAITLSAVLYFLCRNPEVLDRLRCELDDKKLSRQFSEWITFKEAQDCPYLQAVIKETMRLHPGNGLPMPRIVPQGGLDLAGRCFPEGTIVGVNAWVANVNQAVFGQDANVFRPERWLVSQESSSQMEQYFFTFGKGPRTCIGRNVSLMELSKLIPELVLRFHFDLVNPEREWTVHNDWFVRVQDFPVIVSKREPTAPLIDVK